MLALSAAARPIKLLEGEGQHQIKIKYMDFPADHPHVSATAYSHALLQRKLKISLLSGKYIHFLVILFEFYS